jgi:hypothetical protein
MVQPHATMCSWAPGKQQPVEVMDVSAVLWLQRTPSGCCSLVVVPSGYSLELKGEVRTAAVPSLNFCHVFGSNSF